MNSKFGVRDLINAGLFSLLLMATTFLAGMIGFIPVLMPIVPFSCALLSGTVYMLYTTKIKRFGMVLIVGIVESIFYVTSGHGLFALGGILVAFVADLVLKKGHYQNVKYGRLSYVVLSLASIFNFLPIYLSRAAYTQQLIDTGYGADYAAKMMSVLPDWSLIPISLLGCVGAYIGCTIGIKILRKHFEKAGMI